jgi:uncharacterized iron-regulated protein
MRQLISFVLMVAILATGVVSAAGNEWQPHRLPLGPEDTRWQTTQVFMHGITETVTGRQIDIESFYARLAEADVVLIGESHTSHSHHAAQEKIIRGLAARGRQLVLGLEMFNASQNGRLDEFVAGRFRIHDFPAASGYFASWGHNIRYYQPIFVAARELAIPMRGANLPGERIRALRLAGPETFLDLLQAGEPVPDMNSPEHRFFIETMMQGLGAQAPQMFPGIYLAQCLWDAAMGEGMIAAAGEYSGRLVVGLAGSGHVAYGLGIARIIRARSNLRVVTVMPVDVEPLKPRKKDEHPGFAVHMGKGAGAPEKASVVVAAGLADYLIGVEKERQERYPAPPFRVLARDGHLVTGNIMPGTWAYKNGFRSGDRFVSFAGRVWHDADALQYHLHHLKWGDQLRAVVQRDGRRLTAGGRLLPETNPK